MAEKVYELTRFRAKEAWEQLSEKERRRFKEQVSQIREEVGAENVARLRAVSSQWRGVHLWVYPSMQAYQKYWNAFMPREGLNAERYFVAETTLCVDLPE